MTRRLALFAGIALAATVGFLTLLDRFLDSEAWTSVMVAAAGYALALFLSGLFLGRGDAAASDAAVSLGVRYHAVTFAIVVASAVVWVAVTGRSVTGSGTGDIVAAGVWLLGLVVHHLSTRASMRHA